MRKRRVEDLREWQREEENLRGTTAVNFGAYLPDKIGGREARQEQAGSENVIFPRKRGLDSLFLS